MGTAFAQVGATTKSGDRLWGVSGHDSTPFKEFLHAFHNQGSDFDASLHTEDQGIVEAVGEFPINPKVEENDGMLTGQYYSDLGSFAAEKSACPPRQYIN